MKFIIFSLFMISFNTWANDQTKSFEYRISVLEKENELLKAALNKKSHEPKGEFSEELINLKKELANKNKMISDYQRTLEKTKVSETEASLLKANAMLNAEVRKMEDQIANITHQNLDNIGRSPASIQGK